MKKFLLFLPASLIAFNALAEDEVNAPIFYGEPSNMVLTIQAMDAATEYGDEPSEVNYYLQPLEGRANIYTTKGFDINLKGYTDPVKNKSAKYIYSIKYYKYGYGQEAPEGENNNPIFNNDNSYTVFIGENDNDISLSVCASWPSGKTYVEWIHNFSNIVATDANVYAYLYISGNELPRTFTYVNKFAAQTGTLDGTSFNKYYTKANTSAANISTSFLKGDSQSGLVYLADNDFNTDKEDGVYKATLDYATGELSLTRVTEEFELFIDGFTTVVAPFDFELTDGVNAYTLSYNSDGEYLDANLIEGTTVKAYTPVVITAPKIADYKFNIVSELAPFHPVLVEGQAKKGTLEDSRMDGNVLVGVNHPHWLDVYNGNNEVNNRYTLSGGQFIINKAHSTKKQYDNPITPQYTCYVELPSDLENVPQSLNIVFPEPVEPEAEALYVHFTDENGKHVQTHWTVLEKQDDGSYTNDVDIADYEYFVLSDATFDEIMTTFDSDATFDGWPSNREWNELGEAYVYHLAATAAMDDDNTSTGISYVKTKASELEGEFTPFPINESEHFYYISLDPSTQTITMTQGATTGLGNVIVDDKHNYDGRIFNVYGQQVDENYKGIVIINGKKMIRK